jgi:hypothetical protein
MWIRIRIRNTATYLPTYLVSTVGSNASQCYPGSGYKFGVRSSDQHATYKSTENIEKDAIQYLTFSFVF